MSKIALRSTVAGIALVVTCSAHSSEANTPACDDMGTKTTIAFEASGRVLIIADGQLIGSADNFRPNEELLASGEQFAGDKPIDPKPKPRPKDPLDPPPPRPHPPKCHGPFCPDGKAFSDQAPLIHYYPELAKIELIKVKDGALVKGQAVGGDVGK